MTAAAQPTALEMRGISKRYPGVLANDRITFDVRRGEIHALLGENGAGKTTLMNILYGLVTPDEGEILLNGQPAAIHSPHDAIEKGISMVHQHFMLVPVLTVAENILLGEEPMAGPIFLDRTAAHTRIRELGRFFGSEIDPDAKVSSLSVGWQQRVEILKALYRNADILVLDEPTAVLTPQETREIFGVLRKLTACTTSCPRSSLTLSSSTVSVGAPGWLSPRSTVSSTSRPTISAARSSSFVSDGIRVPTTRPRRRTVMRSATSRTS